MFQRDFEERHIQRVVDDDETNEDGEKKLKEENPITHIDKINKSIKDSKDIENHVNTKDYVDPNTYRTASEKAFYFLKEKRLREKVENEDVETHRDKIDKLNKYLEKLPVHFDIPRVGPG